MTVVEACAGQVGAVLVAVLVTQAVGWAEALQERVQGLRPMAVVRV